MDIISKRAMEHGPSTRRVLATAVLAALLMLNAAARAGDGGGKPVGNRGEAEALFAHDGRPAATAFEPPPGFSPRSRAGLYATADQVAWQALTAEPYTVVVDVDGRRPLRQVVAHTMDQHRWSLAQTPHGAAIAYYVRASSPRRAVAAADALTAAGVPLVFVVVDGARARPPAP